MSRTYPYDHKIPEVFQRQLATKQSSPTSSPNAGLQLSSLRINSAPVEDQGFTLGGGMSEDFKHWLHLHPGLSLEEALRRYSYEQKAEQRLRGPKLH